MVYLISGNSNYLINKEIKNIIKDDNYISIDYLNSTMEDIITECTYTDLFASKKIIIVKNSNIFNTSIEKDTLYLEKYLECPNELCTLIFITNKINAKLKSYKLLNSKGHVNIIKDNYSKDNAYLLMEEVKQYGYTCSYDIAKYIIDASLNNVDIAISNMFKIIEYYNNKGSFKIEDVKEIVSSSINDNEFKFVDSIIEHDYETSFKMLEDFKLKKIEPFILFNLITREFRNILLVMEGYKKDRSLINTLNLADWQIDKYLQKASKYTEAKLHDELVNLANIDYNIKMGKIDKYLALEMYILGR